MLIPPKVFHISGAASTDADRYQLNGVHLTRTCAGQARAEATDGKILMRVEWDEPNPEEFPEVPGLSVAPNPGFSAIVPTGALKDLAKWKAPGSLPILTNVVLDETAENGTAPFVTTNLDQTRRTEPKVIDGCFPDVDSVLGGRDPSVSILVDILLLKQLVDTIVKTLGLTRGDAGDLEACVTLEVIGPDKPLTFHQELNGYSIQGLIMPRVR